jgi:tetratricopeptide (TPR) repeat protein
MEISLLDAEAAIAAAQRAVAMAPHAAEAHHALARAHLVERERYRPRTVYDPEGALPAADEAVRLAPHNHAYRATRAWALVQLKRPQQAAIEYRRILETSPNNTTAVNGLGWLNRRHHPILAAGYFARSLALTPQSKVVKMNLKGAIMMWVLRMVWIWLWGGLALGLLRWVVPRQVCALGVIGLLASCLIGSAMLRRHLSPGALGMLWALPQNAFLLLLGRLAGSIGVAVVAATASPMLAVVAVVVLVIFLLVEWKVDFTDMDQRFTAWVTRS